MNGAVIEPPAFLRMLSAGIDFVSEFAETLQFIDERSSADAETPGCLCPIEIVLP